MAEQLPELLFVGDSHSGGVAMSKLDIRKCPERFSHIERAQYMHNLICTDPLSNPKWEIPIGSDSMFGVVQLNLSATIFLEGAMIAAAFCSGAISGGKLREMVKASGFSVDAYVLNKFLESAMNSQTLWDKKEEVQQ